MFNAGKVPSSSNEGNPGCGIDQISENQEYYREENLEYRHPGKIRNANLLENHSECN